MFIKALANFIPHILAYSFPFDIAISLEWIAHSNNSIFKLQFYYVGFV